MKLARSYLLWCLVALGLLLLAVSWIPGLFWIVPDQHTRSAFLQTYNPMPLLKEFQVSCPQGGGSGTTLGTSTSASAGYNFLGWHKDIEHRVTFKPTYCGDSRRDAQMMTALHENIVRTLKSDGCHITADSPEAVNGIRVTYRCGERTTGLVTARPPQKAPEANDPHVQLLVETRETWAAVN